MQIEKKTKTIIIGILIIIAGIIIYFIPTILKQKDKVEEEKQVNDYIDITSIKNVQNNDNVPESDEGKEVLMVLEIPKINLKKGLYYVESKYNEVTYNVEILKDSNMPSVENGNLILAGHSGDARMSHFRYLSKVDINDKVYVYYEGTKYTYMIDNIYDIQKTGTASIEREENKTTITLITCKDNTSTEQKVFIGYLIEKEEY